MLLRGGLVIFIGGLAATSIVLLIHLYTTRGAPAAGWKPLIDWLPDPVLEKIVAPKCSSQLDWLDRIDRPSVFNYARREVVVRLNPHVNRSLLTKVEESLFPRTHEINLSEDSVADWTLCQDPLILDVPAVASEPADASYVVFGISTTMQRLKDSIPALMRWLPKTRAKLVVIVIEDDTTPANDKQMEVLQAHMRDLGIDTTLIHPKEKWYNFSIRYFSLIKAMYTHRTPQTRWVSLIDDDTFFPSMSALLAMLDKHDDAKEIYLGAVSEDWWATVRYGMMAFGGAGIFLSLPLAELVDRLHDICIENSHAPAGDIRVKECIIWETDHKITPVPELHQMDLHGDLSGFFESGRLPLSLHHWKEEEWGGMSLPLPEIHRITDICGDCFMQRWQFGPDMILSNGISISVYPKQGLKKGGVGGVDGKAFDFDKLERTWDDASDVEGSINHGFDHSLPPTRRKLVVDEEKITFKLHEMEVIREGVIRQSYFHQGVNGTLDTVYDLIWMREDNAQSAT